MLLGFLPFYPHRINRCGDRRSPFVLDNEELRRSLGELSTMCFPRVDRGLTRVIPSPVSHQLQIAGAILAGDRRTRLAQSMRSAGHLGLDAPGAESVAKAGGRSERLAELGAQKDETGWLARNV